MNGSQEALVIFAVIVGILVYVKGQQVNIPFIAGGQATAGGLPDISPGDQS